MWYYMQFNIRYIIANLVYLGTIKIKSTVILTSVC